MRKDMAKVVTEAPRRQRPETPCNTSVDLDNRYVVSSVSTVTSQEFRRWLQKQGCRFEAGHGGHLIVRLGARMSVLPMHGKQKELGTGLVNSIKKISA